MENILVTLILFFSNIGDIVLINKDNIEINTLIFLIIFIPTFLYIFFKI